MKQVLLIIAILILAAILYLGGMIVFAIITQYNPAPVEEIEVVNSNEQKPNSISDSTFTFLTWNVGYGGLGAEVDFFYDGGKMVTSPKEHVLKNNKGMVEFLSANKDIDFIYSTVTQAWKLVS